MKKQLIFMVIWMLGVSLILMGQNGKGNRGGQGNQGRGNGGCNLTQLPYEDVSETEKQHLLNLREEEKLARDVYNYFAAHFNLRIFERIATSENRHMEAVKVLLDKYDIQDPVGDNPPGQFSNGHFQDLYQALIAEGELSIAQALQVGAKIEDMDIFDLQNALHDSDNQDIKTLYQNLSKGSRNHLRSFVSQLQILQLTYIPQFISPELYEFIINSPWERGPYNAEGRPMMGNRGSGNRPN